MEYVRFTRSRVANLVIGGMAVCATGVCANNHNEEALAACEDLEGQDCHPYCVYYHELLKLFRSAWDVA